MKKGCLLYLLFYGAVGAQLPFLPLFLSQQGFSVEQTGVLIGLQGVAVLFAPGISSHFADTVHGGAKTIAILCSLLGAFFLYGITQIQDNFLLGALLILGFGLFFIPLFSLIDGISVTLLKMQPQASLNSFSSLRAFGTLGFMLPLAVLFPAFYLLQLPYQYALYFSALLACMNALVIHFWIPSLTIESNRLSQKMPVLEGITALRRKPLVTFTIVNFLIAMGMGTYYSFFSLRLKELGVAPHYIGVVYNLGPFFEFFFLMSGSMLLQKLGVKRLLLIAAGAGIIRFLILAYSENIFLVCLSMLAHAPIIMALAVLVNIVLTHHCEPHYRYSVLGLTQILNGGVARLIGGFVGGVVVFMGVPLADQLTATFLVAAALCLGAFLLSFTLDIERF